MLRHASRAYACRLWRTFDLRLSCLPDGRCSATSGLLGHRLQAERGEHERSQQSGDRPGLRGTTREDRQVRSQRQHRVVRFRSLRRQPHLVSRRRTGDPAQGGPLRAASVFPKGSPPPSAERPSTPTNPMRFVPASGADRPRATTKAIHAYPTGLSPRRLELPLLYHRFLWIRLQFSRPAQDLPGSGNSLAGRWRGRKPGHDLTASLDIHRFCIDLDTSNDLKATRAKVCH